MQRRRSVPLAEGPGAFGGWSPSFQDTVAKLRSDVEGLKLRLQKPVVPGVPACYRAARVFEPETFSFDLDTQQTNAATNAVNYVVRDGQTYDIPVLLPGPGVFVAESINVAIYQRIVTRDTPPEGLESTLRLHNVAINTNITPFADNRKFTTKFSIWPRQVSQDSETQALLAMNYFWNLVDSKSGRQLSDDLMSHMMLMPRVFLPTPGDASASVNPDGDRFRFDAPWLFERDGQANFLFRPITPVLQFDSSVSYATLGLGFEDDRVNGKRYNPVTVCVELHGYRFETKQDALRAGALSR